MEGGQSWDVKPESGATCGPKGSPEALSGRPRGRGARRPKRVFFTFFFFSDLLGFLFFFFVLVVSLLLSFGNHHFFCSCSANRLNPFTNFCIHLGHIPAHPPAPSLCMLRLVFSPKFFSPPRTHAFFVGNQPLELLV